MLLKMVRMVLFPNSWAHNHLSWDIPSRRQYRSLVSMPNHQKLPKSKNLVHHSLGIIGLFSDTIKRVSYNVDDHWTGFHSSRIQEVDFRVFKILEMTVRNYQMCPLCFQLLNFSKKVAQNLFNHLNRLRPIELTSRLFSGEFPHFKRQAFLETLIPHH